MAKRRDRLRVQAAISRLISGSDADWLTSARTVIDAGILLPSAGSHIRIRTSRHGMPQMETPSVAYGFYVLEHMEEQHSIEISNSTEFSTGVMQTHQIFYDEESGEPLTVLRVSKTTVPPADESLHHQLILLWDRWMGAVRTRVLKTPPTRSAIWAAREAVVLYSNVPEYKPGDHLNIA